MQRDMVRAVSARGASILFFLLAAQASSEAASKKEQLLHLCVCGKSALSRQSPQCPDRQELQGDLQ